MEQLGRKSTAAKYQRVINELGKYSHFSNEVTGGKLHLKGKLDVGYGVEDSFNIEVIVNEGFPQQIPLVYELDGRIPVVLDRHFMTDGNGCCLVMPHKYREIYDGTTPFSDFIDKLVVPFFQNQIYYEITGDFFIGYAHGQYGKNEFYEEIFGKTDTLMLLRLIGCVLNQKVAGHKQCPCQSSKRQRYCHGAGLTQLARFGDIGHLQSEYVRCRTILEREDNLRSVVSDYVRRHSPPDYMVIASALSRRLEKYRNPKIELTTEILKDISSEED